MRLSTFPNTCLATLAITALSTAQQPEPTSAALRLDAEASFSTSFQGAGTDAAGRARLAFASRVCHDVAPDGVLWTSSATYKVGFDAHGALYVPFLGSSAPRSFPVRLALAAVRAGGVELGFTRDAEPRRDGDRVAYDRGSLREVYDLRVDGVEQSFDVPARVHDGDLVIDVSYLTELAPEATATGFVLSNELGRVECKDAFAIDAAGRRIAIALEMGAAGTYTLTVPDAWLDAATFPVRVDPTFTTSTVAHTPLPQNHADVAFDRATGRFLVVWESAFNTADHDVACAAYQADGTLIALGVVDNSIGHYSEPRVGHVAANGQFLTVVTGGGPGLPTSHIYARMMHSDGASASALFTIDPGSIGGSDQPDVGGDGTLDPAHDLCVVWRHQFSGGSRIAMRRVSSSGALSGAVVDLPTAAGIEHHPRISDTHDGSAWTVAWQRDGSGGNNDIWFARPRLDFSSIPFAALATTANEERSPCVSAFLPGTSRHMVVYEQRSGGNSNIMCTLLNDMMFDAVVDLSGIEGSTAIDTIDPTVATDGKHYLVTYRNGATQALLATEFWFSVAPVPIGVADGPVQIVASVDERAEIAGYFSTGGALDARAFTCPYTLNADIDMAQLHTRIGGSIVADCFGDGSVLICPCTNNGSPGHGCANSVNPAGALLATSGSAGLGAEDTLVLLGTGMPALTSCLFFQGTELSHVGGWFGDGARCASGTVVRLGLKLTDPSGASQYPAAGDQQVTVRGGVPFNGGLRGYQVWYRNAASFCTGFTFNLSNGIRVRWAP